MSVSRKKLVEKFKRLKEQGCQEVAIDSIITIIQENPYAQPIPIATAALEIVQREWVAKGWRQFTHNRVTQIVKIYEAAKLKVAEERNEKI